MCIRDRNSFANGMSITNGICQAPATCESVVAKNRGTAKSGYSVRKMSCCLIGLTTQIDDSVQDTQNNVIWNKYGNDCFAPEFCLQYALKLPEKIHELERPRMMGLFTRVQQNLFTYSPVNISYLFQWYDRAYRGFREPTWTYSEIFWWKDKFIENLIHDKLVYKKNYHLLFYITTSFSVYTLADDHSFGPCMADFLEKKIRISFRRAKVPSGELWASMPCSAWVNL